MAERTFSKKCAKCGQRAVTIGTVPYKVQVDHDGRKYEVFIPALSVPRCGNCEAFSIDAVAEKEIDTAFRRAAGLLTPEQIREGREKLGFTQKQEAAFLALAPETLSRWENGSQVQQRAFDRLL